MASGVCLVGIAGCVALIANYRSQFDSVIRRTSFEQLLARMKALEDKRTGFEGGQRPSHSMA